VAHYWEGLVVVETTDKKPLQFRQFFKWIINKPYKVVIIAVVLILVFIRLLLPQVILAYANKQFRTIPGYSGNIRDIDLHLLSGYYRIEGVGFKLTKGPGHHPVNVFSTTDIEFHLLWSELFKGHIVGSVMVNNPNASLFERMLVPQVQVSKKPPKPVSSLFRNLLPIRINEFGVRNGEFHFKNYIDSPEYDIYIKNVRLDINNITNNAKVSETRYANAHLTGTVMKSGKLIVDAIANPISKDPDFYVASKLIGLNVEDMNTFTRAYAGFDFEKGTFSASTEITSTNNNFDGYVRSSFHDLKVFSWNKDVRKRGENISKVFWEAIVGTTSEVLKNQKKDVLATRIPIKGTIKNPQPDIAAAIVNVLKDAFIKAYLPKIEHSIPVPGQKEKKQNPEK
jgi:hypothetical protein